MMKFIIFLLAGFWSTSFQSQATENCQNDGDISYICGLFNAEDLIEIKGTDLVLAGQLGGSRSEPNGLYIINKNDKSFLVFTPDFSGTKDLLYKACPGAPNPNLFAAHGIAIQFGEEDIHKVYVVSHAEREGIEIFDLDVSRDSPKLTWKGCVIIPENMNGNSVTYLPNNGLALTSFGVKGDPKSRDNLLAGRPAGMVMIWHPEMGWSLVEGSEFSGNNGITTLEGDKNLYVAAWGTKELKIISGHGVETIALGDMHPDNIRRGPNGSLIIGGQVGTTQEVFDCLTPKVTICGIPYRAVKVDPNTHDVEVLVDERGGKHFGGASVAIIVGDEIWVGPFKGNRVAIKKLKN
jgi:hypothetical protein